LYGISNYSEYGIILHGIVFCGCKLVCEKKTNTVENCQQDAPGCLIKDYILD
jgi:hypothetical protein